MAYAKFVLLSVFLLATFVTFPIKKVETRCSPGNCTLFEPCIGCCNTHCYCVGVPTGICLPDSYKDAVKIVGENLICQNDVECKNKGAGNFCVRSPKPDLEYGVCANFTSEAENLIFKIFSKFKFTKDFAKFKLTA
ncbi:unnamed protein product [Trifolium pratense]|uniref:Uncharacterized protein n=1 Tax=Trifolium pratense TaxID=57577 RepID=A0ACB0LL12_TRIPR|nr:unnamed protein product [Trifolium pratense]